MKTLSKRMLILLIFFQVITVFYLLFIIVKLQKGSISVNNLNKDNFYYSSNSSELRYMYIPQGNRVEEVTEAWLSEKVTYTFNNDGLHDRNNYEIIKKNKVFRIITLGDSFTFGMNVSTYQNWTEQLEDKLNNNCTNNKWQTFEVINLGVSGYDTKYSLARYLSKGKKYDPDLVIWMIFDPERNEELAGKYREEYLGITNNEFDTLVKNELGYVNKQIYSKEAIEYLLSRKKVARIMSGSETIKFNLQNIHEFREHYSKKLLLVSITEQMQLYIDDLFNYAINKGLATDYIPVLPTRDHILSDGHLNLTGHTATADILLNSLIKNEILDCSL